MFMSACADGSSCSFRPPKGVFLLKKVNFLPMNQPHRSAAIVPQRFDHPPKLERTYSPVKIKSRCSQPGRRRRAGCPRTGSPARLATALVTFEPGARTTWHCHPIGQTLTSSRASAGCRSRAARCAPATRSGLRPARSIGHGAAPTTAMVRLAMQEALDGKQSTGWSM